MVAKQAHRPATYADLEALPPNMVGEIVRGVLYANPRPATLHARASSRLGGELSGPFDRGRGGPGGWILLDEPELHFGDDVVVPDLAGWRRARMPELPQTSFLTLAPDWLCEVLSPSTAKLDRTDKLPLYASVSVTNFWLVDPIAKTLEVLRLDGATYRIVASFGGDDAKVRAEPFDVFELELGALWER